QATADHPRGTDVSPAAGTARTGDGCMADAAPPASASSVRLARLPYPPTLERGRLIWPHVGAFLVYHLLSLAALLPWLFSSACLLLFLFGCYLYGTLGINLGYHRLLTHRSFKCPLWLEHALCVLGACCLQDTPARWVGVHRLHHQHGDEPPDPHSPLVGFF